MIQNPRELDPMTLEELTFVAQDIRSLIIHTCLKNGGHLGASLGAVEIAIALHRCFKSPSEPIIWDVGHQAYAHKILTGRADRFETLRLTGGLSGFLSRDESLHDIFGAGHSSTSLSAALAIANVKAGSHSVSTQWTVAVIGDGGLTAGLALEALNHAPSLQLAPLLIVVNDNQMSISPNVGAIPRVLGLTGCAEGFFSAFGMDYVGPLDGHDLVLLIAQIEGIKQSYAGKPVVLHVRTQKGKGYTPAEERPAYYHGVGPATVKVPGAAAPETTGLTYSQALGEWIMDESTRNENICAITAAMAEGTGLADFASARPEKFYDVGIAEPHAVTFAAGLATQGKRPIVAIYSTFLQRALDEIIHDVALQKLPVIFAIDRAGVVGADGPTHHGAFDLAYLRGIPGLSIYTPSSPQGLKAALDSALLDRSGPSAIRYPRGTSPALEAGLPREGYTIYAESKAETVLTIAVGPAIERTLQALKRLNDPERAQMTVIGLSRVKPFPTELKTRVEQTHARAVLTIEDGMIEGGVGQSILSWSNVRLVQREALGYHDQFIAHATVAEQQDVHGLSPEAIAARMRAHLAQAQPS